MRILNLTLQGNKLKKNAKSKCHCILFKIIFTINLLIINLFTSIALAEESTKKSTCSIDNINELIKNIENFDDKTNIKYFPYDVSSITNNSYILNCNVVDIIFILQDAGFKLSRNAKETTYKNMTAIEIDQSRNRPHFFAVIQMFKNRSYWIYPLLQLEIAYELGQVKLVKALIIQIMP